MIIHSLVAENKGIYNGQISYSWDKFEGGLLLGLGMINMDSQPLVPYWDLFNQALCLLTKNLNISSL